MKLTCVSHLNEFSIHNRLKGSEDTNQFFLLHGVTSAWSLCQIVGHLEASAATEALFYYLNALLVAFMAVGSPDIDMSRLNEDDDSR